MADNPDPRRQLDDLRREIDAIDARILARLNERAQLARRIGEIKQQFDGTVFVPGREEDLLRRLQESNPGPFPSAALRPVWKEIISASLSLEHPLGVAYLGPEATFTHQASLKRFGVSTRQVPARTIADVFAAVEKRKVEYGVIPVENSTEGVVSYTLDLFVASPLRIVAEVHLRVTHHLLSRSGDAARIARIHSHPQALAQCRDWLERHFPETPVIDASSTAHAAAIAAEDEAAAAIAGDVAAELHGLQTVEARIEDNPHNITRFLVLGHETPLPSVHDKTTVVFAVRDEVGALHGMLRAFADHGVNLTRIQSRPMKGRAWQYVFFVDCEGHGQEPALAAALAAVEGQCRFFKVLGSYPRSEDLV